MNLRIAAIFGLAGLAVAAHAQDCLWSHSSIPYVPASLFYDPVQSRILAVFSDHSIQTWNGSSWVPIPVVGNPGHGGAMTLDTVRGRLVQQGGATGPSLYSDTWEWDGLTWTLQPQSGPSGISTMVFDVAHSRSVLYHPISGSGLGQTWTWDGSSWTQAAPSGPVTGSYPMVYDGDRQRVMLFGPVSGPTRQVW